MLNQTIIVGRLVKDPELDVTDTGKKMSRITLAVPRSYKNSNGLYDTDYIDCKLWTGMLKRLPHIAKKETLLVFVVEFKLLSWKKKMARKKEPR